MANSPAAHQFRLPAEQAEATLQAITAADLSFAGAASNQASHNTHAFAAKFPPQLPRLFIDALTEAGDLVLDPMAGSGTTLVEAALAGRRAIGVDLDPLAAQIAQAKVLPLPIDALTRAAERIEAAARSLLAALDEDGWQRYLDSRSPATRQFIAYWFDERTARELWALSTAVLAEAQGTLAPLFRTLFSSLIVTKSGGVSLARDLAHSRPHKVGDKTYRDVLRLFHDRSAKSIAAMAALREAPGEARIVTGDARNLPLPDASVDLVVTSPPYANAIDYMRAHKFSLVWLGHEMAPMTALRRRYIGAESALPTGEAIPSPIARNAIAAIAVRDRGRARTIERYFGDVSGLLAAIQRVLKPGRPAVIVVGASTARGVLVPTAFAYAEIAESLGFRVVGVRERPIDRNRRLMPFSRNSNGAGIEARMASEHVISLVAQGAKGKS